MARRRMLAAVKTATVVITNPTHFAVALEYHRDEMPRRASSPRARTTWPQRIRADRAATHGVPIVENVAARAGALQAAPRSATRFPPTLFGAVAEVLAYLVRIKQLML